MLMPPWEEKGEMDEWVKARIICGEGVKVWLCARTDFKHTVVKCECGWISDPDGSPYFELNRHWEIWQAYGDMPWATMPGWPSNKEGYLVEGYWVDMNGEVAGVLTQDEISRMGGSSV